MASKIDYLKVKLNASQLQITNPPLWEVINELIRLVGDIPNVGVATTSKVSTKKP